MGLELVRSIELPKITDHRGNLSVVEGERHIPFPIQRIFYVYDIPSDEYRGAHAHRMLEQVVICLSGGLEVYLDDGREKRTIRLNRPWQGLYLPPMIWAAQGGFDPGTVYVVLASQVYDEADYIRDYDEFRAAIQNEGE